MVVLRPKINHKNTPSQAQFDQKCVILHLISPHSTSVPNRASTGTTVQDRTQYSTPIGQYQTRRSARVGTYARPVPDTLAQYRTWRRGRVGRGVPPRQVRKAVGARAAGMPGLRQCRVNLKDTKPRGRDPGGCISGSSSELNLKRCLMSVFDFRVDRLRGKYRAFRTTEEGAVGGMIVRSLNDFGRCLLNLAMGHVSTESGGFIFVSVRNAYGGYGSLYKRCGPAVT
eukprot:3846004-Rhodomonas_salina.2